MSSRPLGAGIEVSASTTLTRLHDVIQAAMGWEDLHLHCFRILGRRYDGEHADLTRVFLADLRLHAGERFTYTYNHFAGREHELRVEAVGPGQPRCRCPPCVGDRHPCPPEWCFGPEALDEIRGDLLGLTYAEDLDLMVAFGRAVLDGGFVRGRAGSWFEVVAGNSVPGFRRSAPEDDPPRLAKCFAFVQAHDDRPRRRLLDVLAAQGYPPNQKLVLMSDGGESVRRLVSRSAPKPSTCWTDSMSPCG